MIKKYKLSKYVKRFDRAGYTCFFNGLTMKKTYALKSFVDSILKSRNACFIKGSNKNIDKLIKEHFLVAPGEDKKLFGSIKKTTGKIRVSNIVMLVSNDCNYACSYCQIEENMQDRQKKFNMTLDTAKKALDLFEKNSKKEDKKTISVTGGEPFLNFETVKYIIERAKTIPNTRVILFTNGSLITKGIADYLQKNKSLVLVSLDGPKKIHDDVRINKTGKGTFNDSLRGFNLLRESGFKCGISAVTGKHNKKRMNEVTKFFLELDPRSIGLNFGHYLLGKENPTVIKMEDFADMLIPFYKGMREKNIFVENISRFITPFYQERPLLNECQAQGRGFTVDSRGKLGVCKSLLVSDDISKSIDKVKESIADEPVFKKWAKRSPFNMKECADCEIIGVCGGGCTYDSFAINKGDIFKIDKRLCGYTERVLEFLIWDLFDEIKDNIGDGFYLPSQDIQEKKFLKYYDSSNELQRSVGHEKDR